MSADGSGAEGTRFYDHFSGHANAYAAHRPTYPAALFDYLARQAPGRDLAWDCATGNGQAAVALASHFEHVIATDASVQQLMAAEPHPRVTYRRATAEAGGVESAACDLVTVAQAVHWFDFERFYAEVRRVLKPDGLLAVWTYDLMRVDPAIDPLLDRLHDEIVGPYWPDQRRLVDGRYADLPFPFPELEPPPFELTRSWTVDQALAYIRTWSAVQRFTADQNRDPLAGIESDLRASWGGDERPVEWPLTVRVGRPA